MNNGEHIIIKGIVSGKTRFPHDISHVDMATDDGLVIVETNHAVAQALALGEGISASGTVKIERTVCFLVDATVTRGV
jgi:hypothetical protein